jgi:hypothetical protein
MCLREIQEPYVFTRSTSDRIYLCIHPQCPDRMCVRRPLNAIIVDMYVFVCRVILGPYPARILCVYTLGDASVRLLLS